MTTFSAIKNIIFDLGAVIIPIDFERTFQAFATLSDLSKEEIKMRYQSSPIFLDFEKGLIGNFAFLKELRALLNCKASITDEDLTTAWNTLLLPIPKERIDRIQSLSHTYRLFLLSNTNPIHIAEVNRILFCRTAVPVLEDLFEKTWYSYDLGLIKPHTAIYDAVLKQKNLDASETVFLDDNADNIAGAASVGIHAMLVTEKDGMVELLKEA